MTLRVFVNLVQIPVLLLDNNRRPLPPIPQSRFTINIAGLAPFKPTKVRLQGEDPISLTILVDSDDPGQYLWERLGKSSKELAASLRPHDTVEVYGVDGCKMRRFLGVEPFHLEDLRLSLENAAALKPYTMQRKQLGPCDKPIAFWDAMLYVASKLQQRNGRRVLLVLSSGHGGSTETRERLHKFTSASSITIFGVHDADREPASLPSLSMASGRGFQSPQQAMDRAMVNPGDVGQPTGFELQTQAELSGGMVLAATSSNFGKTLAKSIELARGRYILEFPRPLHITAGERPIDVSIGNPRAFIRSAGISVPLGTDEEKATDPVVEHGVNQPQSTEARQPPSTKPRVDLSGQAPSTIAVPYAAPPDAAIPSRPGNTSPPR